MQYVPLVSIHVPTDRQRKEFKEDSNVELISSIESKGLFHPVLLRGQTLVAGERRLRAITDIYALGGSFNYNGTPVPEGLVPATQLSDLSPLEVEEAEFEENARRENLTWSEAAAVTARLADLRNRIAAEKGLSAPTHASLAEELLEAVTPAATQTIRKQLIVAKFAENEGVQKAPSLEEAFKTVKKIERDAQYVRMAATLPPETLKTRHQIFNEDSLSWMERRSEENLYSIILTDPPYGMGADEFGDSGGRSSQDHSYVDSYSHWTSLIPRFASEAYRMAATDAHAYVFCDVERFSELRSYMSAPGWKVFRTPLIWHKPNGMRAPWPSMGPQRKYECILFAVKGNLTSNIVAGDVLTHSPDANLGHAAQKPVSLFVDLLKRSYRPGARILDPFMGSGTILPAAHSLGCTATGIELDPRAFGMAKSRLELL